MTTYPLDKLSYFLFQDSASEVSYASERIIYLFIILFFQKRKGWHQKARPAQGCFPEGIHTITLTNVT